MNYSVRFYREPIDTPKGKKIMHGHFTRSGSQEDCDSFSILRREVKAIYLWKQRYVLFKVNYESKCEDDLCLKPSKFWKYGNIGRKNGIRTYAVMVDGVNLQDDSTGWESFPQSFTLWIKSCLLGVRFLRIYHCWKWQVIPGQGKV